MLADDNCNPSTKAEGKPPLRAGFDSYRSLAYPNVRIIVAADVVPPFRFTAGGWEFLEFTNEVGPATQARITQNGYFLFLVNEDQTSGTELADLTSLRDAT